jgi:hypothetical protein
MPGTVKAPVTGRPREVVMVGSQEGEQDMETSNRRAFLTLAGKAACLTGVVGASAAVVGCPPPQTEYKIPEWPWPYAPLDVEMVRKLGHQGYYGGGCCYGAFWAIVEALKEAVGDPFDKTIPDMMRYGGGGVAGFGSLCGALNGAAAAIGLVSDRATQTALVQELMAWYAVTPFPSDISNQYAVNHEFLVEELKYDGALTQSVAGGNLCHMSVTNWCIEAGVAESDVQRAERCARLTGDVAAKAVELLNAQYEGTFTAVETLPSAAASCKTCHTEGGAAHVLDYTNGKENCDLCHAPHF